MLNTLRNKNNVLLKKFKLENNKPLEEKHNLIATLLSHNNCFFKLPMDIAFNILSDLGYNNQQCLEIYKQLVSIDNFNKFKNSN
jgi:hypothetical protein